MEIKQDYDFNDLRRACWQGAEDTLRTIEENGKEDEFIEFLECYYGDMDEVPTLTQVNDLLWFEPEFVYEQLGIVEDEEDEDDEDEDED